MSELSEPVKQWEPIPLKEGDKFKLDKGKMLFVFQRWESGRIIAICGMEHGDTWTPLGIYSLAFELLLREGFTRL